MRRLQYQNISNFERPSGTLTGSQRHCHEHVPRTIQAPLPEPKPAIDKENPAGAYATAGPRFREVSLKGGGGKSDTPNLGAAKARTRPASPKIVRDQQRSIAACSAASQAQSDDGAFDAKASTIIAASVSSARARTTASLASRLICPHRVDRLEC